jgi:hypothetical protein
MTRSHYLPAAYLGCFSIDTGPLRDRRIWILRRGRERASLERASKVLRVNNLYVPALDGRLDLESFWQRYERKLPSALRSLAAAGAVDALTWAHVLVPFVAGTLLRGPEFERRFRERVRGSPGDDDPAMLNVARLFEFQRILAPVLTARWIVLQSRDTELVVSDIGWVHASDPKAKNTGIAIVVDPRHVLMLVPAVSRVIAAWDGARWNAAIERGVLAAGSATALNALQARRADRLILGPRRKALELLREPLNAERAEGPEPLAAWGIHPLALVVHEFEWWRVVRALRMRPEDIDDFRLDFRLVDETEWYPSPILPTNLPEFESGLSLEGSLIRLTFTEGSDVNPASTQRDNANER